MRRIIKFNLLLFSVLVIAYILNCVKREHSNPLDPKYVISGSGPAAPSLFIPKNGNTINDNTPLFDWSEVDRVGGYHLLVTDTSGITVLQQNNLTASDYTASSALSDGKYFWKVRSRDGLGNWGGWSATWSFTIDTTGPAAPTLSSPTDGSTISDNKPSFDWNDVSGVNIYEFLVTQHVSGSTFITVIQDSSLTSSGYMAKSVLSDGRYFWKVRCRDKVGNWGGWSLTWSITIGTYSIISISPDPLNFSSVTLGQSKDLVLNVSNKGYATLNVTGITSTTAQFTIVGSRTFNVPAGSYQDVTVRFTPGSTGNQSGTLHVANNSSVNPKDVSLSGTGTPIPVPTISVEASLDFGSVTTGNWGNQTLRITNNGNAVLSVTGIISTVAQFTIVGSTTFNVPAGSYQDVTVRFTPGSTGNQSGTLHIANNSSVNPKDVSLSATGTAPLHLLGLIAYYPFKGNAYDESGNNNNGTIYGAQLTADRFGNLNSAYNFNGNDEYIDIGQLAQLQNSTAISISIWIRKSKNNFHGGFIGKWSSSGDINNNTFLFYNGEQDYVDHASFDLTFSDGSYFNLIANDILKTNVWIHLVAVWQSIDGFEGIYENGNLIASNVVGMNKSLRYFENYNTRIGHWGDPSHSGSEFYFAGDIDDIQIYNKALNYQEIQALYHESNH